MNDNKRIDLNLLWDETEGGKTVILNYYPQAQIGFNNKKSFRLRPDDKSPSASVFKSKGGDFWLIQDKGGTDTKARNAITLVMEKEGLTYGEAIRFIAVNYAPKLLDEATAAPAPKAKITKAPEPADSIQIKIRKTPFTKEELKVLGYDIKQENCQELHLKPLEYFITVKDENGCSWKIEATENYPIYYYDYDTWGKIYQPFGKVRFLYYGTKPDNFIFADAKVLRLIQATKNGKPPAVDKETNIDERIENLIICSGGSDALNISAAGYHVSWLNGETAKLEPHDFYLLKKIAKNIFICYDLDNTGKYFAYSIALKYLDIRMIWLPADLHKFKHKGKPCKDAKDFFLHYRTPKAPEPRKKFEGLVKTAKSLQFWADKFNKNGDFLGYDIDNAQLYLFLMANGLYKVESNTSPKGFTFCYVSDNIISRINEEQIVPFVNDFLIKYIHENPEYYTKLLENSIHRSNQVKLASIEKINFGKFDLKSYSFDYDFFFFRNTALRITKEGVMPYKLEQVGKHVYDFNIIGHDFTLTAPPFDISYTDEYSKLLNMLDAAKPRTPQHEELKARIDEYPEENKYSLVIHDKTFSFLNFVYNTGRVHWKKEEAGHNLTDKEQAEQNLFFISKICAIGYLLFRFKESGQAYYVYGMETEQGAVGAHLGGTGKSILFNSIERCRNQLFIDGQRPDIQKSEHLFSGVERGVTEVVLFDDLHKDVDLHRFLNTVTGKMEVRALYKNTETIQFKDSPKVAGTSNHSVRNLDNSLRRRIWFVAFCDYYHAENKMYQIEERSPFKEFGKNLLDDYTPDEMNRFYNFMAYCLHTYMKFRRKIQPPMAAIDKRIIQRDITDEFIWWADDWFTDDKLNIIIEKTAAFEAWKETLPKHVAENWKAKTFTNRLMLYCQYRNWIYNPPDMLKTKSEKDRNEIREYKDGKDTYCFYIRTADTPAPAPPISEGNELNFDEQKKDEPPF